MIDFTRRQTLGLLTAALLATYSCNKDYKTESKSWQPTVLQLGQFYAKTWDGRFVSDGEFGFMESLECEVAIDNFNSGQIVMAYEDGCGKGKIVDKRVDTIVNWIDGGEKRESYKEENELFHKANEQFRSIDYNTRRMEQEIAGHIRKRKS